MLLAALLVAAAASAEDNGSHIASAEIVSSEEGYTLNADFAFDLGPKLADALDHGVSLHFVAELRIERPRWYWFDKVVVDRRLEYRLSYHAITRGYRLSAGSLHQSFGRLEEALRTMQHIRNWRIAPAGALTAGVSHEVALRFRHDATQLPKPFQLSAVASGEWDVDTGWVEWTFLPGMTVLP
ncbi:MAG: DUF4390 domain-containing protein [Azoarcus sp.]|jgi:hypothetical protein|nr:DUF4390 domain-containing protein [Azoarcus sp.]